MTPFWTPDRSRARWRELHEQGGLAALKAERETAIATTESVAFDWWSQHPSPFPREIAGAADEPPGPSDDELGRDAGGRIVVQRTTDHFAGELYSWGEGWCEVVAFGNTRTLQHFLFEGDRVVEEIRVDGGTRLDGELTVAVTRWIDDDAGRPGLAVETYESGAHPSWGGPERGQHWRGKLFRLTYADDGALARITCANSLEGIVDGTDVDAAHAVAIAGEHTLFHQPSVLFDADPEPFDHALWAPDPADDDTGEPTIDRPASRDELTQMLRDAGLSDADAGVIAGDARWGVLAEGGGTGVSRLGGLPNLEPGTPWPTADGRPLTHLATIAFDELPTFDGRDQLPATGLLSLFVDLSDQGLPRVWEAGERHAELLRLIDTDRVHDLAVDAPAVATLPEQRIHFTAALQLRPMGHGFGNYLFGIDAPSEKAVERLRNQIATPFGHQLLGHPPPVQDDPRSRDQITLLRVAPDGHLDFAFVDGGDLHFFGAADDLRAARWDRVTVVGSSG